MDSVKRSAVTPSKSRLARTFAKVFHIQAVTGIAPDDGIQKTKFREKMKKDQFKHADFTPFEHEDAKLRDRAVKDAFISKLFAGISAVKAAYAQLQFAQSPYDADGIQSADRIVVSELKYLSELKQRHLKKQLNETSPEATLLLSEIQEQKSILKTYEITNWNLDAAANSIEPGTSFWKPNHKCFAFESFVCKQMFDGFNYPNFSTQKSLPEREKHRCQFLDRFMELKSVKPADYLAWKPKSPFATFCRTKYLKLVHPKMEASLFGNLDQRNLVNSGDLPETPFFTAFSEMAKRIWLLHCLALSFDPQVSIFQASKGSRFSEVYMESLRDEALLLSDVNSKTDPRVAFSVVPGFGIGKSVIQCQVYLC